MDREITAGGRSLRYFCKSEGAVEREGAVPVAQLAKTAPTTMTLKEQHAYEKNDHQSLYSVVSVITAWLDID